MTQVALPARGHVEPRVARKSVASRRHRCVAALREALESADAGSIAALRRWNSASPPSAFYRITVSVLDRYLPADGPRRDRQEARWAVVVSAMATAPRLVAAVPFGEALARAGVAELRVIRLLEASEAQLPDLVRTVVHQLVQKSQPFDAHELADLVVGGSAPSGREARRRIARSFYRHERV